ncbi:epoxyqueuosine reductase [Anaeroselena agilis]|uniref:Epoxyqueuosine reductase n=1 Tax=Anaeroselena agilis TaxID=3063788 RepID=A0ABU3NZ88_9FIRM|nr:epoxyqueuosine reductase [Selenomonadales bacterium 4137-cl]
MRLEQLAAAAANFAAESPLNRVPSLGGLQIFDPPLMGVAAPDDPLFARLKEPAAIGPHHLSPHEWLPAAGAVVSYFLPFTAAVRHANRQPGLPAAEWLYGRFEGEMFNDALRRHLADLLAQAGHQALVPVLEPRFAVVERRSNWSERHVAHIAGLGTFSLNCSLITTRGAAGRLGSLVTSLALEPTPRPYTGTHEYCTNCGACIGRCPPAAIDGNGKRHQPCSDYLDAVKIRFQPRYGCGKCQTAVPCEDRIPGR